MLHDRFAQLIVGICLGATLTALAVMPESLRASVLHQRAARPEIRSLVPKVAGSEVDEPQVPETDENTAPEFPSSDMVFVEPGSSRAYLLETAQPGDTMVRQG